jgi:hypothetical protein
MKKAGYSFLFVVVFCFSIIQFFRPAFLSVSLQYNIYYVLLGIGAALVFVNYKRIYISNFNKPVVLLLLSFVASAFAASYSWGQSITESLKALLPYMSYILFFVLFACKIDTYPLEKIIAILGISFMVIYILTFIAYPRIIFNGQDQKYSDERGFARIVLIGAGYLFLFSFYALSTYMAKRQLSWLALYLVSLMCIVMTLTRTYIAVSLLFSCLYALRSKNLAYKFGLVCVVGLSFFIITKMSFFKLLVEETKTEAADGKDNIRIQSYQYYLNNFSPNTTNRILGNGSPYQETRYFYFLQDKEKNYGLYISDIGYAGLYVKFGIFAIMAYLIIIYQTIKTRVEERYLYCKYFLYFIFCISIIIDAPFDISFIPAIVIAMYMLSIEDISGTIKSKKLLQALVLQEYLTHVKTETSDSYTSI